MVNTGAWHHGLSDLEQFNYNPKVPKPQAAAQALTLPFLLGLGACVGLPPAGGPNHGATSTAGAQAPGATAPTAAHAAKTPVDPQILQTLLQLFDNQDTFQVSLNGAAGTPEGDLATVGSPQGFALRNYYFHLGIPLARAFSFDDSDPMIQKKLKTAAYYDQNSQTRSAAMILLAQRQDINDKPVFDQALQFFDHSVRFGAMEALAVWGHPSTAIHMLNSYRKQENIPILKIYAATMMARLGSDRGLAALRDSLQNNGSWVVQAMAARALGNYGSAQDYDTMISLISQASQNDFLLAEYCVAALKLFPKKSAATAQQPL